MGAWETSSRSRVATVSVNSLASYDGDGIRGYLPMEVSISKKYWI